VVVDGEGAVDERGDVLGFEGCRVLWKQPIELFAGGEGGGLDAGDEAAELFVPQNARVATVCATWVGIGDKGHCCLPYPFRSVPRNSRPVASAASMTEKLPAAGSTTRSPGFVVAPIRAAWSWT